MSELVELRKLRDQLLEAVAKLQSELDATRRLHAFDLEELRKEREKRITLALRHR